MLEQNKARKWIRRGRNMYIRIITHHFMPSEKSTFTVFLPERGLDFGVFGWGAGSDIYELKPKQLGRGRLHFM